MKNREKKWLYTIAVIIVAGLFLTACFEQIKTDEGLITINLGSGRNARSVMPWPTDSDSDDIIDKIDFEVTLTGPGPSQVFPAKDGDNIRATVLIGVWNVKIDAYLEDVETWLTPKKERLHYATGSDIVDVKAGQVNPVSIKMTPAFDEPDNLTIKIDIKDIIDGAPVIDETIIISRTGTDGYSTKKVITVTGAFNEIAWYIDDIDDPVSKEETLTLDATDSSYNAVGDHSLTVEVLVGGIWYNTTITFTVEQ
jgi:hypothetical protein